MPNNLAKGGNYLCYFDNIIRCLYTDKKNLDVNSSL